MSVLYVRDAATGAFVPIKTIKGEPGAAGVSPKVDVAQIDGGHRVTITDADGETSFDVLDGEGGGIDEEQLTQAVEEALNEAKASGEFDGPPGAPGAPGEQGLAGEPGKDGVSPSVWFSPINGGYRLTIADANGEHSVDILNGEPGIIGPEGPVGPEGPRGEVGKAGTGMKRIATHPRNFTAAEWQSYGAIDHPEGWSYDSSIYDNSHINIGDTAYMVGTVSDGLDVNGKPVGAAIYGVVTEVSDTHVKMTSSYLLMGYAGAVPPMQSIVDSVLAALPTWTGGSY